jgi:hypothetical protein
MHRRNFASSVIFCLRYILFMHFSQSYVTRIWSAGLLNCPRVENRTVRQMNCDDLFRDFCRHLILIVVSSFVLVLTCRYCAVGEWLPVGDSSRLHFHLNYQGCIPILSMITVCPFDDVVQCDKRTVRFLTYGFPSIYIEIKHFKLSLLNKWSVDVQRDKLNSIN